MLQKDLLGAENAKRIFQKKVLLRTKETGMVYEQFASNAPKIMINSDTSTKHTPLYRYAGTIKRNWENLDYAAKPYVDAMFNLDQITDNYGADTARSVVAYFLANAKSWRGELARSTKAELRKLLS